MQLLVLKLDTFEFILVLGNGQVHELEVSSLLVLGGFVSNALLSTLEQFDLLHELVLFLAHFVNASNQVHVVLHEARIVLTVLLKVARQLLSVVSDVGLVGVTLSCLSLIGVNLGLFPVILFLDPSFVQSNDALLKLFVVLNVLNNIKDVVLKTLLLQQLHVKLVTAVEVFVFETLVLHLQVIDNEVKVVTNSLEVLHFDLHLVDLLVKRRNVVFSGQNVSLQLLDLVVEHEFKFLEFLRLLFQLNDTSVFVFNGRSSRLKLCFLGFNLVFQVVDCQVKSARLTCFFGDFVLKGVFFAVCSSVLAGLFL